MTRQSTASQDAVQGDETDARASLSGSPESVASSGPTAGRLGRERLQNLGWQIALATAFLMLWEFAADRWVSALLVSRPSAVGRNIWQWIVDGTYLKNIGVTIYAMVAGFLVGAGCGTLAGFVTGSWKRLGDILEPFFTAFYTLPRLALAPLFLLWFGLDIQFRIIFAATIIFFLVYYNTFYGVREVSRELIDAVRIMGASRLQLVRRVIVPSALVWVAAGLKISVPYALVGVVVAEMLASNEGLGYLLSRSATQFSSSGVFASIAALLVISLIISRLVSAITHRALRWKTQAEAP